MYREEAGKRREDFFAPLHFNLGGGRWGRGKAGKFFLFWLSIQKDLISASLI